MSRLFRGFVLLMLFSTSSLFAGSLLAKINFVDQNGNLLEPQKGMIVLTEPNQPFKSPKPITWVFRKGQMHPSMHILPLNSEITFEFKGNRLPHLNIFNEHYSLRLGGRHRRCKKVIQKAGEYRIESDLSLKLVGRLVIADYQYKIFPDKRGVIVIEDIPVGKYEARLFHPQLENNKLQLLQILETKTTQALFELQGKIIN